MRVKGVTFDFWESLFGFVKPEMLDGIRRERVERFSRLLNMDKGKVEEAYTQAIVELTSWRERTGFEFCVKDLMETFLKKVGVKENGLVEECCKVFVDSILHHFPGPNPGAIETVKALKEKGLKLAVISNTVHGTIEEQLIEDFGLKGCFSVLALSCRLGVRKPRRDIFMWTASKLQLEPHQLLHIGDDPQADVFGALRSGFWSGHYLKTGVCPDERAHVIIDHWEKLPEEIERLR